MAFINVKTGEYPLTLEAVKKRINVSLGADADLLAYGYANVITTPPPQSSDTQEVVEAPPKLVNHNWMQQWEVRNLTGKDLANATNSKAMAEKYALFAAEYEKALTASLPKWSTVETVISNIDSLEAAKSFLHQLSRVVYLLAKRSIN